MWSSYIDRLVSGLDLEAHEISSVMETILLGKADISEIKSFLVALKNKGETVEEVSSNVCS
jgi:anthranilate phosphoribosyltransferase